MIQEWMTLLFFFDEGIFFEWPSPSTRYHPYQRVSMQEGRCRGGGTESSDSASWRSWWMKRIHSCMRGYWRKLVFAWRSGKEAWLCFDKGIEKQIGPNHPTRDEAQDTIHSDGNEWREIIPYSGAYGNLKVHLRPYPVSYLQHLYACRWVPISLWRYENVSMGIQLRITKDLGIHLNKR